MAIFTLKVSVDGAAFDDGNSEHELAAILRNTADKVETSDICRADSNDSIRLRDTNGNTVGSAEFVEDTVVEKSDPPALGDVMERFTNVHGSIEDMGIDALAAYVLANGYSKD